MIPSSIPSGYTMADVAQHNSQSSCWTVVNGSVYDLTAFIGQHPGGPGAIVSLCGIDGTDAFTGKHGGQPRPEQELASLKIGTLAR
jgi:cytochrome b involved in lipid metabolism